MERRNFLKSALLGGIAGAVQLKPGNLFAAESKEAQQSNDLVAVMGDEGQLAF